MSKALFAFLFSVPVILTAQTPAIALGTRVRIEMHDKSRIEGTLMAQSAESLAMASPRSVHTGVSSEFIARVRRGEGRSHGHGAVKGIKIGAGIVGGATAIIFSGAALASGEAQGEALGVVAVFTFAGALSGAFYGAIIGGVVGAEKWTTVYTAPHRVSLAPPPGTTPGIGIRVSF